MEVEYSLTVSTLPFLPLPSRFLLRALWGSGKRGSLRAMLWWKPEAQVRLAAIARPPAFAPYFAIRFAVEHWGLGESAAYTYLYKRDAPRTIRWGEPPSSLSEAGARLVLFVFRAKAWCRAAASSLYPYWVDSIPFSMIPVIPPSFAHTFALVGITRGERAAGTALSEMQSCRRLLEVPVLSRPIPG
ncbi:hypothetical protein MSAN_02404100 [Mycena sanguinolenta]|uniref:Uncharacterized protein n=1 Tax=Mycena sanguinolenta TaxID=230812 RepID=A0A8H7CFU3_9AGAR|nr:hypothetical protein MSAN_02404100 [Mycena sanguinolenta]